MTTGPALGLRWAQISSFPRFWEEPPQKFDPISHTESLNVQWSHPASMHAATYPSVLGLYRFSKDVFKDKNDDKVGVFNHPI